MPKKSELLKKLFSNPYPHNFTIHDLDALMNKCGCKKYPGGRGSALRYVHTATNRVLQFDGPHPGKELYRYQIDKVRKFLTETGEA